MPHAPALSLLHAVSTRPAPALVCWTGHRPSWVGTLGLRSSPLSPPAVRGEGSERAEDADA